MIEALKAAWATYLPDYRDRCPDRPWWKLEHMGSTAAGSWRCWVRSDGKEVKFLGPSDGFWGVDALLREEKRLADEHLPELARIDPERPLPCPSPACGQVWARAFDGGWTEILVVCVAAKDGRREALVVGPVGLSALPQWPPPGAHLVGGPQSPWSPPEKT